VPVIDSHTHIFPPEIIAQRDVYLSRDGWFGQLYANPQARMATAAELIDEMDRSGVDMAVTFGFPWSDPGLCREANDYVLGSIARWPQRLVGFAVANPAAKGASAEVERCLEKGLQGLGELMPDGQGYALDDDCMDEMMEQMTHWQRPVLIHAGEPVGHIYPGKSTSALWPIYSLALRHPRAKIIAAHWGGGLLFYELMPEVRDALRNVYYDTAASLYLYDDAIFALAAQVAPTKILFGTDYPLIGQERFIHRVHAVPLAGGVRRALLGGNAIRLIHAPGSEDVLLEVADGMDSHICRH